MFCIGQGMYVMKRTHNSCPQEMSESKACERLKSRIIRVHKHLSMTACIVRDLGLQENFDCFRLLEVCCSIGHGLLLRALVHVFAGARDIARAWRTGGWR